jgi:hypothetical protein
MAAAMSECPACGAQVPAIWMLAEALGNPDVWAALVMNLGQEPVDRLYKLVSDDLKVIARNLKAGEG